MSPTKMRLWVPIAAALVLCGCGMPFMRSYPRADDAPASWDRAGGGPVRGLWPNSLAAKSTPAKAKPEISNSADSEPSPKSRFSKSKPTVLPTARRIKPRREAPPPTDESADRDDAVAATIVASAADEPAGDTPKTDRLADEAPAADTTTADAPVEAHTRTDRANRRTSPGKVAARDRVVRAAAHESAVDDEPAIEANMVDPATLAILKKNAAQSKRMTIDEVVAKVESVEELTPVSRQRLVDQLRASDPTLWPLVVQAFRASLAYHDEITHSTVRAEKAPRRVRKGTAPSTKEAAHRPAVVANPFVEDDLGPAEPDAADPLEPADNPMPAAAATAAISDDDEPPSGDGPQASASELAPVPVEDDDWQQRLAAAIETLESTLPEAPRGPEEIAQHVYLRLLCLAAGRRDDAMRPISGIPSSQQDYWRAQFESLTTFLDNQSISDPALRAATAAEQLTLAVTALSEQGPLAVSNLTFCTEVVGFGVYRPFTPYDFPAGQEVLLYAEVENFTSQYGSQGYHTALRTSWQIVDREQHRVGGGESRLTEEYCRRRRRDFFVRYFLRLPERIEPGEYTLELTIEDTLGQKLGQSTVDFRIRGS